MDNKFGRVSEAAFVSEYKDDRTILKDISYTAPYKIAHPFYRKSGITEVMLMSASAGIMAGDRQEFSFRIGAKTKAALTSQSFEKIHRMESGNAKRTTNIIIESNAYFDYNPLPVLPFAGSAFESKTTVLLADSTSRFVMQEITSCGRKAMGEVFAFRYYYALTEVRQGARLIYRDNTRFRPGEFDMAGIGMFEGFSHQANLLIFNITVSAKQTEAIRDLIANEAELIGGVSGNQENGMVIRLLGQNAQQLETLLAFIRKIMKK